MAFSFPRVGKTRRRNVQNIRCRLLVTFLNFLLLIVVRYGDCRVMRTFEGDDSTPMFDHLVIDKNTGRLFVGATNSLYQLTPDLNATERVKTGPVFGSYECGLKYCPQKTVGNLKDDANKALVIDYNTSRIISCGTVLQGACTVRSLNNVSDTILVKTHIVANTMEASTVAFIAPGPPDPSVTRVMYVGATYTGNSSFESDVPAIASRSLDSENMLDVYHQAAPGITQINVMKDKRERYLINYVYGFSSESFSYFLTTQKHSTDSSSPFISKVVRLCHEDERYYSYTEIPLECAGGNKSYNLVRAAYTGKIGTDLATNLSVTPRDDVLFTVFSSSNRTDGELSDGRRNDESALCVYSLKAIKQKFLENIKVCFNGMGFRGLDFISPDLKCIGFNHTINETFCGMDINYPLGGNIPVTTVPALTFDVRLTAVTATSTGNSTVVFVGTSNGHVKKIVVESSAEAVEYGDVLIQEDRPINPDLLVDHEQKHLYAMTKNRISMVKIHECQLHTSCLDCLAAHDPYCGWCSLENKCTLRSACKNVVNDPLYWIPYKMKKCPTIASVTPSQLQKTTAQTLHVVIDNFPLLVGPFFCTFSLFDHVLVTNATRNSSGVDCATPPEDSLSLFSPYQHDFTTKLSVKTEKGPDFADTYFTFFDCNTYTSCTQCVNSTFPCDWCIVNYKCTHDTSGDCGNDTIISRDDHRNQSFRIGPSFCPSYDALENEITEIFIPTGVKTSLKVRVRIIDDLMVHSQFSFKFNIEDRVFSVRGTFVKDSVVCDPMVFIYYSHFPNITATFDIHWNESKPLDNPSKIHIVLYKCSRLADDCGMCLTLPDIYRCGWCRETNSCEVMDHCDRPVYTWLNSSHTCPNPRITYFWPQTGPREGHTNITIVGKNLGKNFNDIHNGVTVADVRCVPYAHLYEKTRKIVCKVDGPRNNDTTKGPVVVKVNGLLGESKSYYHFVDPVVTGLYPSYGPKSGGTTLTLKGNFMNAGSNIQVYFEDTLPCVIINSTLSETICITSASGSKKAGKIKMLFDYSERNFDEQMFEYSDDPSVDSVESNVPGQLKIPKGIVSGGMKVAFVGKHFSMVQNPRLYVYFMNKSYFGDCFNLSDSNLICETPEVTPLKENQPGSDKPLELDYGFQMDNVTGVQNISTKNGFSKFLLYSDPVLIEFDNKYKLLIGEYLVINGHHLDPVAREADVTVQIGTSYCNVTSLSKNQLICSPPPNQPPAVSDVDGSSNSPGLPDVIVSIGSGFKINIGKLEYAKSKDNGFEITVLQNTFFNSIMGLFIFLIILFAIFILYYHKPTSIGILKNKQEQMNEFQLNVASECKKTFTELQTENTDISGDLTSGGIPFLDYRMYSLKILFPGVADHEILKRGDPQFILNEKGTRFFEQLVLNKTFSLLFIRTLECNICLSMNDRVRVASLIMISLQGKMEYCTDVLKTLLAEAIKKHIHSNGQSNPKLLFRSSESVAEKMLSVWFSFLLYKFLRQCAGKPLYALFNATKQQINKGPVDEVTSEAKYSLNESTLITQPIDFVPMTVHVSIYRRTSAVTGLDLNIASVPVKVLDCDTISQVKEKSLDTIYRAVSFSQRPRANNFDVEWNASPSSQLILSDDDLTTEVEGEWRKLNTLHHYNVPDGACLSLVPAEPTSTSSSSIFLDRIDENEKLLKPIKSRFFDRKSHSKDTTPLKHWHLVRRHDLDGRPEEGECGTKMVSEIYLTRLLTTKNVLQNLVDGLFETILGTTHGGGNGPLTFAIKYMFDFLDDQAAQHGITDHEVINAWKINSLPLRFWVNLIKNPDFIFDVHKSNNVDSCLTVVAQAFIDSFSTSDHRLGKDSPSSKLLFAKDVPVYKGWVKRYFSDVKNMPAVSDQDMNAKLAEESAVHGAEFNTDCALYELYGFVAKYSAQLMDTLEKDEFSQKQRLPYELKRLHDLMTAERND